METAAGKTVHCSHDGQEGGASSAQSSSSEISEITGHIFVGSAAAATDENLLNAMHISAVVNVTPDIPCIVEDKLRISIIDSLDSRAALEKILPKVYTYITERKRVGKKVLVHCRSGKSRSVTVVLAYLIFILGMTLADAWALMKSKRPIAMPNLGFQMLLHDIDAKKHGYNTFSFFGRSRSVGT